MGRTVWSREELVSKYKSFTEDEWNEYILDLSTKGQFINNPLYHLSFNSELDKGVITPKPITGLNSQYDRNSEEEIKLWTELLPPRFCMSSMLDGCWKGICATLEKTLIENKVGNSFKMYLYRVKHFKDARILTPDTLTNNYLVHDAHITYEYALIAGGVSLIKDRVITFENTSNVPDKECYFYTPFDNKRYKTEMVGIPMRILNEEYP